MNFFLRLFCIVLVMMPLVTTTASVTCDAKNVAPCYKDSVALSPQQQNDSATVCRTADAMIKCVEKFFPKCSSDPIFSMLKLVLNLQKQQYNDVCGPSSSNSTCKDGFTIFDCYIPTFHTIVDPENYDRCKQSYAAIDCQEAFFKRCPNFNWLTKDRLKEQRKATDLICPSGVSMTMSSLWVVLTLSAWSGLRQFL